MSNQITNLADRVAPHTGAWIETALAYLAKARFGSPLTQGRGLKHKCSALKIAQRMSPLTQGRGLKREVRPQFVLVENCRPSHRGVD